jgi:predicted dehydrogenase
MSTVAAPSEIRWGILGPGFVAGMFAEDLARTPGARCVAVAARDAVRAGAFAQSHGITRAYGDYAQLAADPEVDIVYVATPHSHHFAHAKMMLDAGKSVLLEKPFTMNAAEAATLIALARQRGLFLMDAMWTLCNPLLRRLIARVRAGDIGTPRAFSAILGPIGVPQGHRVDDPALGGSYMLECLVYPMNILAALAPDLMTGAKATASAVRSASGADSSATIHLANPAGIATMSGGFVVGGQGAGPSGFQLIGDAGWLCVTDNLFNPGRAQISARGAAVEDIVEPACVERYRWEIEEVGRCLRDGLQESPLVPLDLTLAALRVLDQAIADAKGKVQP